MKNITLLIFVFGVWACCTTPQRVSFSSYEVPYTECVPKGGRESIAFGGYGSAIAYDKSDGIIYLLTDRGPNVDGTSSESKIFPFPEFVPTVGKFVIKSGQLELLENITLKDFDRSPLCGLPNRVGDGVTGEVAYDLNGEIVVNHSRGIDSEGLAVAPDKTIWVSDEYAPFIMQFSAEGVLIREFKPGDVLPDYYSKRRPNRGMEGLTISNDGKKLYGAMQSPLYIPDSRTKNNSVNNRIIEIDLQSGKTREFLYRMESVSNMVSEILYVDSTNLLILERDGKFPTTGFADPKAFKRVYRVDTQSATDISNMEIEILSLEQLKALNVTPLTKSLELDILQAIPNYSHDKPEGIAFIKNRFAIINDDDFASTDDSKGGYIPKKNSAGQVDRSTLYLLDL